ncbi:hypothetical protein GYMLUDRAFT_182087 [Collybiopsis luxurians FD-317 M1]|uniref:Uncharacterized protein n=1 Tax=Collybiopsis luxurians FD-317 M1 TaxID=944289 RepID=A0A0D0BN60_9AGAR|nr:hypothetical protein GYMLUDRAFT_182087 [Collybiopsis luxurians FD-317 M1]
MWLFFAKDGIELQTLEDFIKDLARNAPQLKDACIDKFGADVMSLKKSPWNQALIHKCTIRAQELVDVWPDGQFGEEPIDWLKLFNDKFYRIYKAIIDS